jgi:N-acetylglutamate synthase-like GNAT family acetyltransferase
MNIRPARLEDLDAINRVIESAVMTWNLPERVKRLSLSSYRYNEMDFKHLDMIVAEDTSQNIIGVAAWEEADKKDLPEGKSGLLLHGIYVDPRHHHRGTGKQLLRYAEQAAQQKDDDGVLVKAQADAEGFFIKQGMQRLPVENAKREYANRFWKEVNKS